jgi:hypothetical protein
MSVVPECVLPLRPGGSHADPVAPVSRLLGGINFSPRACYSVTHHLPRGPR